MTTNDATPRESVNRAREALSQIHDKYQYPVSLAFDLTDSDIEIIARLIDDAFERGCNVVNSDRKLTDLIEDGDYLLQQHEKAVICRDANIGNAQNFNRVQDNFAEASMASSLVAIAVTMTQILEEVRKMNSIKGATDER